MNKKTHAVLIGAAAISLSACTLATNQTNQPAGQFETLDKFVQQSWKLPNFQLSRDVVMSKVPLRVSTYSYPSFIHRGQLNNLATRSKDLAGFCEQQGGQWRYLGPPVAEKSEPSQQPMPSNTALADAVNRAPVTENGMRDIVKMAEQASMSDVFKSLARSMLKQPDPLVADAIEYAMRQKWLGRFECQRDTTTWSAKISYAEWANRTDRTLIYKDVTLKIELAENK